MAAPRLKGNIFLREMVLAPLLWYLWSCQMSLIGSMYCDGVRSVNNLLGNNTWESKREEADWEKKAFD